MKKGSSPSSGSLNSNTSKRAPGAGNATRMMLDSFSCKVQKTFSTEPNQIFTFLLPSRYLREDATSFADFKVNDAKTDMFRTMFELYVYFVYSTVRGIDFKEKEEKKQSKQSKASNNKSSKGGGPRILDDESIEEGEQQHSEGTLEDQQQQSTEDIQFQDFQQFITGLTQRFGNPSPSDNNNNNVVDNDSSFGPYAFVYEPIFNMTKFSNSNGGKEIKDRHIEAYRFWFFNGKRGLDANFVFSKIIEQFRQTSLNETLRTSGASGGSQTKSEYAKTYRVITNVQMLSEFASTAIGINFNPDSAIKCSGTSLNDTPFKASNLFNPMLSFLHPSIKKDCWKEQTIPQTYVGNTNWNGTSLWECTFPPLVRRYLFRYPANLITEDHILRTMLPQVQLMSQSSMAQIIPIVLDQIINSQEKKSPKQQQKNGNNNNNNADEEKKYKEIITDIELANSVNPLLPLEFFKSVDKTYRVKTDRQEYLNYAKTTSPFQLDASPTMQHILSSTYSFLQNKSQEFINTISNRINCGKMPAEIDPKVLQRAMNVLQAYSSLISYTQIDSNKLSPAGAAIENYRIKEKMFDKAPLLQMQKKYTSTTPLQDYIMKVSHDAEHVYGLNDKHQVFMLVIMNCMDAYRVEFNSIHQHSLMRSDRGNDSKSFILFLITKHIFIDKTTREVTYMTMKSRAVDGNMNDMIMVMDEMQKELIDHNKDSDVERMFKQLLSSNRMSAEFLTVVDGQRISTQVDCEAINMFLMCMNFKENLLSDPMKRRMLVIPMDEKKQPQRSITEKQAFDNISEKSRNTQYTKDTDARYHLVQILMFHLEKLIHCGVLPQVSYNGCEVMILFVGNELERRGITNINPSYWNRIRVCARAYCLLDAILCTWMFSGTEFYGKTITFEQFLTLDKRLWIQSQHVIKAIIDHQGCLIDPGYYLVKRAIAEIIKQRRIDNSELACYKLQFEKGIGVINPTLYSLKYASESALITEIVMKIHNMKDTNYRPNVASISNILKDWYNRTLEMYQYETVPSYDPKLPDQKVIRTINERRVYEAMIDPKTRYIQVRYKGQQPSPNGGVFKPEKVVQTICQIETKSSSTNIFFVIHRDFLDINLEDDQETVRDARDVFEDIFQDFFSHQFQIPQRMIFDNSTTTPKRLNYLHMRGPSADQRKSNLLYMTNSTTFDEYDKDLVDDLDKFKQSKAKDPAMMLHMNIDSAAMFAHNRKIGLTKKPIPRATFHINDTLNKKIEEIKKKKMKAAQNLNISLNDDDEENTTTTTSQQQDTIYDESGSGYFMGTPLEDLRLSSANMLLEISSEEYQQMFSELNIDSRNKIDDPLSSDVDFDVAHHMIYKHPSGNPYLHKYIWDVLADNAKKKGLSCGFDYCGVEKSDTPTAELIERRKASMLRNIEVYKPRQTHPLLFRKLIKYKNLSLGLPIKKTKGYLEPPKTITRSQRLDNDKNFDLANKETYDQVALRFKENTDDVPFGGGFVYKWNNQLGKPEFDPTKQEDTVEQNFFKKPPRIIKIEEEEQQQSPVMDEPLLTKKKHRKRHRLQVSEEEETSPHPLSNKKKFKKQLSLEEFRMASSDDSSVVGMPSTAESPSFAKQRHHSSMMTTTESAGEDE